MIAKLKNITVIPSPMILEKRPTLIQSRIQHGDRKGDLTDIVAIFNEAFAVLVKVHTDTETEYGRKG